MKIKKFCILGPPLDELALPTWHTNFYGGGRDIFHLQTAYLIEYTALYLFEIQEVIIITVQKGRIHGYIDICF